MSNQLYVTFVRHGQTKHNAIHVVHGQTESPLSPTGINQAELLGKELKGLKFDRGFASDLSRAHDTAQIILNNMNCDIPIELDIILRERNFGDREGKPFQEILDAATKEGLTIYEYTSPNGETPEGLNFRVSTFFKSMCKLADEGKNEEILVVSHGGWIAALMRYLNSTKEFNLEHFDKARGLGNIPNTCRTRMRIHPERDDQRTITFSHVIDLSHLEMN